MNHKETRGNILQVEQMARPASKSEWDFLILGATERLRITCYYSSSYILVVLYNGSF